MQPITIVSGLPRSGTSMMMKMLEAGGLEIFQDGVRQADKDNPKGYYEYEKVKDLHKEATWLHEATGKAIKIISNLLLSLPTDLDYKIIFMQREMVEILASQKKMLERSGQPESEISDDVMAAKFSMHLRKVKKFLEQQKNVHTLYIDYSDVIIKPALQAEKVASFLGLRMNTAKMAAVVDKDLYRQKA